MNHSALGDIILQMRFSAKFHLQMCAVLSQSNNHTLALEHARISAIICEDNIIKTHFLFNQLKKRIIVFNREEIQIYEDKIAQIQKIIENLHYKISNNRNNPLFNNDLRDENIYKNKYTKDNQDYELEILRRNEELKQSLINILGNKKNDDWINYLNIGNIMYLSALNYEDLDIDSDPKFELLRDAVLEKIVMLTVAYFCIATELRFLESQKKTSEATYDKGELWHSKAVEYSCLYLPSICPLVKHYISSYHKHYTVNLSVIPEDEPCNIVINLQRANVEIENDPVLFIKMYNDQVKTSPIIQKKSDKKVLKINLVKCSGKENPTMPKSQSGNVSLSSNQRELQISKSSSLKNFIKINDRPMLLKKDSENKDTFLKQNVSQPKYMNIKLASNNSSCNLINSSSTSTIKLSNLTKLYTNGMTTFNNFIDTKKKYTPTSNSNPVTPIINPLLTPNIKNNNLLAQVSPMSLQKKENMSAKVSFSKLSNPSPINKISTKLRINNTQISKSNINNFNTRSSLNKDTSVPISTISSFTLNTDPNHIKSKPRNIQTGPTSRNSSKNKFTENRTNSVSKDERDAQQLPKIKKLKEFNGFSGSNFTLSLINNKFKDVTGIFNINNKKPHVTVKNGLMKTSKEDMSSLFIHSSSLNTSKPRLIKNQMESHNMYDIEKDLFFSNSIGLKNKIMENGKFKKV